MKTYKEGMTMVVVSHEMGLREVSDRVLFMDDGWVLRRPPSQVLIIRKTKGQSFLSKVLYRKGGPNPVEALFLL